MVFDDAVWIAERCFGELGKKTIFLWKQYNVAYFGGALKPTLVLYVPTSPYGHWVGLHCRDQNIYLMFPGAKRPWGFVRGVLLHEMVHQHLAQCERDASHAGQPWRSEIMRITHLLGRDIWAGEYTVVKVAGRSVRANKKQPVGIHAQYCLNQFDISRWPHSYTKKSSWPGLEPPELEPSVYAQLKVEESTQAKAAAAPTT
jgi:hypothetical protein